MSLFEVYHPNWEWKEFDAIDMDEAADLAAEYYDRDDHTLASGQEGFFAVRAKGYTHTQWYRAYAEPSIDYYSDRVSEFDVDDWELNAFKRDNQTGEPQ